MNTDIIVIGGGPGGYPTASRLAQEGRSVVLIERKHLGGTCLNCGCIPTKSLAASAAEALMLSRRSLPIPTIQEASERTLDVVEGLRGDVAAMLSAVPNLTVLAGDARFVDAHTVAVGEQEITADTIIIATGSADKRLPFEALSPTEFLQTPHAEPIAEMLIIGAGVIGMEFASVFSALGTKVTVVEFLKECLPACDSDIAKRLRKSLEKRGVEFSMQTAVKNVTANGDVICECKGKERVFHSSCVIVAVGRCPNISSLDLDKAGVEYNPKGIVVDDYCRTSQNHIFAIGDVNGRVMLAHAATMQGHAVAEAIISGEHKPIADLMPTHVPYAVFTIPEAAGVGATEDMLKAEGADYRVVKIPFRSNGRVMAMGEPEGMLKVLAVGNNIVGCHAYGVHSADIIQAAAIFMQNNATIADIMATTFIHPTVTELIHDAAQRLK